ncbi:MAG: trypsin-like peptidase domain-containing protein [Lentisphaerae bacterium]|nr:trypsin-like peptidase domain-containing protein [Lentisphaerota bacterium]
MKKWGVLLFFAAGLVGSAVQSADAEPASIDRSLVKIVAICQEFDPFVPWQRLPQVVKSGYGVAVGDGLVATTEDLIRHHVLVEIQMARSGARTPATLVQADDRLNLALLRVDDDIADELVPVSIAPSIDRKAPLQIVQFDGTDQPQTGSGTISEISVRALPLAPSQALQIQVLTLTSLAISGSGVPVFSGAELTGLVVAFDPANRLCSVLPAVTIRKFLEAALASPYPGTAQAGFSWTPLIDPFKRAFLGLTNEPRGVLVLRVMSRLDPTLKKDDVILDWDGFALDAQGYYEDPEFGRLLFPYLIYGRRRPGETVPVKVIRDRVPVTLQVPLTASRDDDSPVPYRIAEHPSEYIVEGGLVLRELTQNYLKAHGREWAAAADPRLVRLFVQRHQLDKPDDFRFVILSRVFPDAVNIGYEDLQDEIVTAVNGEPVKNLNSVFAILRRDGALRRVSLQSMGLDLVFDPAQLRDANARIAKTYRIPRLRFQQTPANP